MSHVIESALNTTAAFVFSVLGFPSPSDSEAMRVLSPDEEVRYLTAAAHESMDLADVSTIMLEQGRQKGEGLRWAAAFKTIADFARGSRLAKRAAPGRRNGSATAARNQRCAIRLTYARNTVRGLWRAHGRYVARETPPRSLRRLASIEPATYRHSHEIGKLAGCGGPPFLEDNHFTGIRRARRSHPPHAGPDGNDREKSGDCARLNCRRPFQHRAPARPCGTERSRRGAG
jgi:hypothetical protein